MHALDVFEQTHVPTCLPFAQAHEAALILSESAVPRFFASLSTLRQQAGVFLRHRAPAREHYLLAA